MLTSAKTCPIISSSASSLPARMQRIPSALGRPGHVSSIKVLTCLIVFSDVTVIRRVSQSKVPSEGHLIDSCSDRPDEVAEPGDAGLERGFVLGSHKHLSSDKSIPLDDSETGDRGGEKLGCCNIRLIAVKLLFLVSQYCTERRKG